MLEKINMDLTIPIRDHFPICIGDIIYRIDDDWDETYRIINIYDNGVYVLPNVKSKYGKDQIFIPKDKLITEFIRIDPHGFICIELVKAQPDYNRFITTDYELRFSFLQYDGENNVANLLGFSHISELDYDCDYGDELINSVISHEYTTGKMSMYRRLSESEVYNEDYVMVCSTYISDSLYDLLAFIEPNELIDPIIEKLIDLNIIFNNKLADEGVRIDMEEMPTFPVSATDNASITNLLMSTEEVFQSTIMMSARSTTMLPIAPFNHESKIIDLEGVINIEESLQSDNRLDRDAFEYLVDYIPDLSLNENNDYQIFEYKLDINLDLCDYILINGSDLDGMFEQSLVYVLCII